MSSKRSGLISDLSRSMSGTSGPYRSNPEQPVIASGAATDRFQDRVVLWQCIHVVASTCLEELWVPLENVLGQPRYDLPSI